MTVNVTETGITIYSIAERAVALYRYPFSVNIKELDYQESAFSQNLKIMKLCFTGDWHFIIGYSNKGCRKLCPVIP